MKIYNKKEFAFGVFSAVLGLLNLVTSLRTGLDVKSMIIVLFLLLVAGNSMIRSFSRERTREDKLEELDERNQLIELKSKSKSFRMTQGICFGLMLVFLIMGNVSGESSFVGIGVGLAFAYTVSMFTEIFTYLYYEKRN